MKIGKALVMALALGLSAKASAYTYIYTVTGVASGTDGSNYFGGGTLSNKSFTEQIFYDPSLGSSSASNGVKSTSGAYSVRLFINDFIKDIGGGTFKTEQSNTYSQFAFDDGGLQNMIADQSSQNYGTLFTVGDPRTAASYGVTYNVQNAATNTGQFTLGNTNLTLTNYSLKEQYVGAPEPETWAMMVIGLGAVGFALRRDRRKPQAIFG